MSHEIRGVPYKVEAHQYKPSCLVRTPELVSNPNRWQEKLKDILWCMRHPLRVMILDQLRLSEEQSQYGALLSKGMSFRTLNEAVSPFMKDEIH